MTDDIRDILSIAEEGQSLKRGGEPHLGIIATIARRVLAKATDEGPDPETTYPFHPDDGHGHWFGCVRCGVDRPAAPATDEVETVPGQTTPAKSARSDAVARPAVPALDEPALERAFVTVIDRRPTKVEVTYFYGDTIPVEVQREAFLRDVIREYAALRPEEPTE